ncbi:hypothetical protein HHK36_029559 [Tetracentron sinense]|uniref:Uncharacterized protein n=1 Tax=Tetracentron sinense TaxID=13715 RepID=A0A835CZV0_TETSI|nr:hypothetical protein HHK36_029559 [Tetracentron sinense]
METTMTTTTKETGSMLRKDTKVEIPTGTEMSSGTAELTAPLVSTQGGPVLMRQSSASKTNCLCSPTTHAGSFRCRLHRSHSLQRTKSMDSSNPREPPQKDTTVNTVEA